MVYTRQVLGVVRSAALFYPRALDPGSKQPRRETGPAAMGHPLWGSSMGFTWSTSEMGTWGASARVHSMRVARGIHETLAYNYLSTVPLG